MRKIPNPSDFKAAFCRRTYCNQKQIGGIFIAKLVVAEKPSVAMSYAKVLGATNRQDGYLEGNGYLVSWCVGHLVELAPPNVYDAKYVKWSMQKGANMNTNSRNVTYSTVGDYQLPNLTLNQPRKPLGKYGRLRRTYLKEHRPVLYNTMLLNGSLYPHLMEVEQTAESQMQQTMEQLLKQNPAPNKEQHQMGWVQHMNSLKAQAEELVLNELIYS